MYKKEKNKNSNNKDYNNDKRNNNKYNGNRKVWQNNSNYGEVIPSMFSWLPIEEQKKRAEELDSITKDQD